MFKHVTNEFAPLIFWMEYYDLNIGIEEMLAIHKNLEIIADEHARLLAYRYDSPMTMKDNFANDGEWQIYLPNRLSSETLEEVQKKILVVLMMKQIKEVSN